MPAPHSLALALRVARSRLLIVEPNNFVVWPNTINHITAKTKTDQKGRFVFLVGVGGFEPPQS